MGLESAMLGLEDGEGVAADALGELAVGELKQTKSSSDVHRSRRELFRRLMCPAVAAGGAMVASTSRGEPNEVPADIDPGALIVKLVKRTTQGATPAVIGLASTLGYRGYLDYQLEPQNIDDSVMDTILLGYPRLTRSFAELYATNQEYFVKVDLASVKMLRSVNSKRQLFERMVEFWTDHFHVDLNTNFGGYFKVVDERDVIRRYALRRFSDFLREMTQSPSMLSYLTNTLNSVIHPNENLARELMELHTIGIGSGYTQQDVEEVARCFTGWFVTPTNQPVTGGLFTFNDYEHDDGEKRVLGHYIAPGGGIQDGYTVIQILGEHPATARHISTKLCKWFLQEQPSTSVIDAAAASFVRTQGDIKEVIRTILTPNALYAAAPKYKRPFHLVTSALRLLESQIQNTWFILRALESAGHSPYEWSSPDGFPDRVQYWAGNVLPRWNFCTALAENQLLEISTDASRFFDGLTTAEEVVDRIKSDMLQGDMNQSDWELARDFLAISPQSPSYRAGTVGLVMSMQSFQWY